MFLTSCWEVKFYIISLNLNWCISQSTASFGWTLHRLSHVINPPVHATHTPIQIAQHANKQKTSHFPLTHIVTRLYSTQYSASYLPFYSFPFSPFPHLDEHLLCSLCSKTEKYFTAAHILCLPQNTQRIPPSVGAHLPMSLTTHDESRSSHTILHSPSSMITNNVIKTK